jgi:FemAB-related protein (PEP-CTERM system-associated)
MLEIVPYTDTYRAAWSEFIAQSPSATFGHLIAWREVIRDSLGHRPHYLIALRDSRIVGVLPLFCAQTWWRARSVISIPWLDYGGVCSEDPEAREALSEAACAMTREWGAGYAEFRSVEMVTEKLPVSQKRVTFLLNLESDSELVWKKFDAKLRNQIRKSQKAELTTEIGGVELLDEFYRVFCFNMRDLGTPVWGKDLFRATLAAFEDPARLILVKKDGQVIAAGLILAFKDRLYVPSASAYRHALEHCPNHALYWTVIELGCRENRKWFDFGRSAIDSNTFRFKKQWNPEPTQLNWQYFLNGPAEIPEVNPRNPKYRMFVGAWQKLPLAIANILGPRVIRNFP